MTIGKETLLEIVRSAQQLLMEHEKEIDTAYAEHIDAMTLSVSVSLKPSKASGTDITTALTFSKGKVSDKISRTVDEGQMQLPIGGDNNTE